MLQLNNSNTGINMWQTATYERCPKIPSKMSYRCMVYQEMYQTPTICGHLVFRITPLFFSTSFK